MTIKELQRVALRKVADFLFTKSQENIVDMGMYGSMEEHVEYIELYGNS